MTDRDIIQMMTRCRHEIQGLREQIGILAPKAKAYDDLHTVLNLLPRESQSFGEDLVYKLDQEIKAMEANRDE